MIPSPPFFILKIGLFPIFIIENEWSQKIWLSQFEIHDKFYLEYIVSKSE